MPGYDKSSSHFPRSNPNPDIALEKNRPLVFPVPNLEHLLLILRENELNWFALVTRLRTLLQNYSEDTLAYALTQFSDHLSNMDLTEEEQRKVELSKQVYLEHERYRAIHDESRLAIDSDSDNPDDWLTQHLEDHVKKQRQLLRRKTKRINASKKAEQKLLQRKVPKAVSRVLTKFPNMGKDIEEFVRSRKVGADAWRRTGVLTFDGNSRTGPKVTYKRIQEHLQKKYRCKFGYGTIVQMCS